MVVLINLPQELLLEILVLANKENPQDKEMLLVCRTFYTVALPVILAQVDIDGRLLSRWSPSDAPVELMRRHTRTVSLSLFGPELENEFKSVTRRGITHRRSEYLTELKIKWTRYLAIRLISLYEELSSFLNLTKLEISMPCWSRYQMCGWSKTGAPFLDQASTAKLMASLPHYTNLTSLFLDLADAETTSWRPGSEFGPTGIGDNCADHVCPLIAHTIASLPKLRDVRIRRRDICPAIFGFTQNSSLVDFSRCCPTTIKLEVLIINIRLLDCQRTTGNSFEAQARHCNSGCKCFSCHLCSETSGSTMFERMANAGGRAATLLPKVKTLKVLGYKNPGQILPNATRGAQVADCLRGTCLDIKKSWLVDWEDEVVDGRC